nr:uncharacterized protein LOC106679298 isoform X2 [Halyomorpha halys]
MVTQSVSIIVICICDTKDHSIVHTCKDVQKKWKSIKDCYYKNLKNQDGRSGDPSKNKKPYIYHKQLTFLQSSVVQRQTSGNMADNLTEGSQDAGKNTAQEDVETESTAVQSTSSTAPFLSGITQREKHSQLPKKRKQDEFEKSVLDVLKLGLQQLQPKEPKKNDPDEMFLLSQLPLIKNFDPADKMDFQIKYLNLVQSYTRRGICMRCRNVY